MATGWLNSYLATPWVISDRLLWK